MNVDIAERLAKRRREAGFSQEALAEKLGVSRQAVSKWERSESSPDTDNLIALAQLYKVSLDELLYVDESIKEDVAFEAADRGAQKKEENHPSYTSATQAATATDAKQEAKPEEKPESPDTTTQQDASTKCQDSPFTDEEQRKGKVHIGFDGIHVNDGADYVHVSWRDGVHVKDSSNGDEVHVGWSGVHVQEGDHRKAKQKDTSWFGARDDEGSSFRWAKNGITINGEHFDNWRDARAKYGRHAVWGKPQGYWVNGDEWFEDIDAAYKKYGSEVGKSIPVKAEFRKMTLFKFPFFLVAIIAYLLIGFTTDQWGFGLFVFFTIPVYYIASHAIYTKQVAPLLSGLYPIGVVAWFLYMAFVLGQPHPAWVAFLTIPVVEWVIHAVSRWWRRRRYTASPIDVDQVDASSERR